MAPKLDKKYEYNGIIKIIKENYDLKSIEVKLGTVEVDWFDFEDVELHVDGKIQFTKGDIEGRKKGYWRFFDISDSADELTREDMATCFAWANVEGQHLFVVISKSGDELNKNKERYVSWMKPSAMSDCSINLMEIKKSELIQLAQVKADKIKEYINEYKELDTKIQDAISEKEKKTQRLKRLKAMGWEATYKKQFQEIVESIVLTSEAKQVQFKRLEEMFNQECVDLQIGIDRAKQITEPIQKRMDELDEIINKKDADELLSSEEEEEEEEEKQPKNKRRRKLNEADKEAGAAEWLSSESSSSDDDEDTDDDDVYISISEDNEEESASDSD
jgi:hypothetical protein